MKIFKYLAHLMLLCNLFFTSSHATCFGRIKPESPSFFSAEFYQPGHSIASYTKEQFAHNELKKLRENSKPLIVKDKK